MLWLPSWGDRMPSLLMQHRALHADVPLKSGLRQVGLSDHMHPGAARLRVWTGNITDPPIWRRTSCSNILKSVLYWSLFSPWSKTGGSFSDLESKRLGRNSLFSALGGEGSTNRSACSLYQAEWRVGGCLHKFNFNFENAALCLHCWTGFFHQLKWYLHTYKVVISIYFILKVLG